MPESVATKALHSGQKHEIDGRLLEVARVILLGDCHCQVAVAPTSSLLAISCAVWLPTGTVCPGSQTPGSDPLPDYLIGPSYDTKSNGRLQLRIWKSGPGDPSTQQGQGEKLCGEIWQSLQSRFQIVSLR
jgi:hypothetical protein